jgi:hypothetical protein
MEISYPKNREKVVKFAHIQQFLWCVLCVKIVSSIHDTNIQKFALVHFHLKKALTKSYRRIYLDGEDVTPNGTE